MVVLERHFQAGSMHATGKKAGKKKIKEGGHQGEAWVSALGRAHSMQVKSNSMFESRGPKSLQSTENE